MLYFFFAFAFAFVFACIFIFIHFSNEVNNFEYEIQL